MLRVPCWLMDVIRQNLPVGPVWRAVPEVVKWVLEVRGGDLG